MFRLSQGARLLGWPYQQRKLLVILLLWGCFCLVILRPLLLAPAPTLSTDEREPLDVRFPSGDFVGAHEPSDHLAAKRAASSLRPLAATAERLSAPEAAPDAQPNVIDSTSEKQRRRQQQQQQQQAPVISSTSASDSGSHRHRHDDSVMEAPEKQQPTANERRYSASAAIEAAQCQFDYPSLIDLQFNNIYWQKLTTRHAPPPNVTSGGSSSGGGSSTPTSSTPTHRVPAQATFYLYNAYYDDRWRAGLPSVRVLAMIDRVEPPPTDCLLWSRKLHYGDGADSSSTAASATNARLKPIVVRAQFVYAWYPKWGNYEDGLLQPWIVTCPMAREHVGLVPDTVSLIEAPRELAATPAGARRKRQAAGSSPPSASIAMPPAYSSSSSSRSSSSAAAEDSEEAEAGAGASTQPAQLDSTRSMKRVELDCKSVLPISNNLPVQNKRPPAGEKPQKFAVCVKGLDFPSDDVSIRLVEWIELLNLLGAKKIFLYQLDVHKNISRVLDYYQQRGIVELSPLTLPGDQPNLPDLQHLYLKQHLTAKRQNELIPYNDCLYRNLYSYKYLALLDIDEIIMPLKRGQSNWYDLMEEVERLSLAEQNYSRASYNVRNVYFFDDLSGPLGTTQSVLSDSSSGSSSSSSSSELPDEQEEAPGDENDDQTLASTTGARASEGGAHRDSAERGIPHYLHMMSHVYRSKNYTEPGQYVKCFHNTERAVSLHNHFPMNCFGQCTTYSIPVELAHLQHYRKDCVGPLRQSCKNDFRHFTTRDTTIWKYKQRMIKRTTRVLNELGLLSGSTGSNS